MRRALLLILATGLALTVFAVPVSAAPPGFRAVIHENFERRASAEPCVFDEVAETLTCFGSGTVQGYGRVTSTVVFSDGPAIRTLTFGDGSTLVLSENWGTEESGTPGNSANAPGALVSFGNPFFDFGEWSVVGGTGQFAGATGGGTSENVLAGDSIVLWFMGELELDG